MRLIIIPSVFFYRSTLFTVFSNFLQFKGNMDTMVQLHEAIITLLSSFRKRLNCTPGLEDFRLSQLPGKHNKLNWNVMSWTRVRPTDWQRRNFAFSGQRHKLTQ